MHLNRNQKKRERGFGFIELIVGLGLLSALGYAAYNLYQNNMTITSSATDRFNKLQLSHDVEREVDCEKLPKECSPGTAITLRRKKGGDILIQADGSTRMNDWNLIARCGKTNRLEIDIRRLPAPGKNSEWQTLFEEGLICPNQVFDGSLDSRLVIVSGSPCYVYKRSALPCPAKIPPPCAAGFANLGVSLDTFGGLGVADDGVFGQRWNRYCGK